MLAYQGPQPQSLFQRLAQIFEQGTTYKQICQQREPLIIGDLHNFPQFVQAYLQELDEPADTAYDQFRAWMGVPLIVRERVIGMLTLTHPLPDVYTPRHANLAFAMANQVAVALENADLYKQARVLAALQERQHLSRELHSSLSREMFGIRLSAQHAREALAAGAYHEVLEVRDDGRGFDPNLPINGGQGLQIMQEQIAPLGGTFTLVSAPGHGTSIIVRLPQHS
jgi:signal transduction histidine kinase